MRLLLLFLTSSVLGNQFWSTSPADTNVLIQQAYPLGNGRLAALPAGVPSNDIVNLNLDSLWYGGPFQNETYNGGNPGGDVYQALPGIRQEIFTTGQGNTFAQMSDGGNNSYGSYTALANLTVQMDGVSNYTSYTRVLGLDSAVHTVQFTYNGQQVQQTSFCSNPDDVCVYSINSTGPLPQVTFGFQNMYLDPSLFTVACGSGSLNMSGTLSSPGMAFNAIARLVDGSAQSSCSNSTLTVPASNQTNSLALVIGANTNYDQTQGGSAGNYSFKRVDPGPYVDSVTSAASQKSFEDLTSAHTQDFNSLYSAFELSLPDTNNSSAVETADLIAAYTTNTTNSYVDNLLFDYGRYLLISSSRSNSLPANLQGKWAPEQYPAWSGDYHIDINLQMNYWHANMIGLGSEVQDGLFNYMRDVWPVYGTLTAQRLYNATDLSAWVLFGNTNTFSYTGMEVDPDQQWADYPASGAWMMHSVSDYLDYTGNTSWYQATGYPLIKGVALFWLSQLQPDTYFNDGTLVAAPCTSPEHGPTTFGCAHYQQLIWELFDRILTTWDSTGDSDTSFRDAVQSAYEKLDKGVHVGSWGQLQEWKIDQDMQNDTHRHLSHLYGWYPGYSVSSSSTYGDNSTVADAVQTTLISRGPGNGPDANAGWEKVWRAACWAGLNNTQQAYFELAYTIQENIAPNGFSMYSAKNPPFQIDANFGFPGAVLAMLARDLPMKSGSVGTQQVILGPAIPAAWAGGSVTGLRLRGGGSVSFDWDDGGVVRNATLSGRSAPVQVYNVDGDMVTSA